MIRIGNLEWIQQIPTWVFKMGWAGWVGLFLVLEGLAVARLDPHDTLSEQIWSFANKGWNASLLVFTFFLWLLIHMTFRGRFG